MTGPSETRAGPAIAAVLLFNPMLGSLYAWSVFLAPLEAELGVPGLKSALSLAWRSSG